MTVQILTATVKSVNIQLAKNGSRGLNIVFDYPDGSQWGKKIYKWFWWEGQLDEDMIKLAKLVEPSADADTCKDVILSHKLCAEEVELQVDQSDERFWKILDFGAVGTVKAQTTTAVPNDDIPF